MGGFPTSLSINDKIYFPANFHVRTVKKWGEDDVMLKAGWDVRARGNFGQFSMIELYLERSDGSWVGQWGAIANFSYLTHNDMLKIGAMQIPDVQFNLTQKMGYLYNDKNSFECEMWGHGDWNTTTDGKIGHMVQAGQKVSVSNDVIQKYITMPNELNKRWVAVRELQMFKRSDFGKTFESHPYLVQKSTVSLPTDSYPFNRYGDFPRGYVYVPVMLDPADFPTNNKAVRAFIPEEWLVPNP